MEAYGQPIYTTKDLRDEGLKITGGNQFLDCGLCITIEKPKT